MVDIVRRGGAEVARGSHKPEVAGSIPAPVPCSLDHEAMGKEVLDKGLSAICPKCGIHFPYILEDIQGQELHYVAFDEAGDFEAVAIALLKRIEADENKKFLKGEDDVRVPQESGEGGNRGQRRLGAAEPEEDLP